MARILSLLLVLLFLFLSPTTAQVDSNPVHQALLCGGTNLVFGWYDTDHPNLTRFDGWLPQIRAAGACHVRLVISFDMLENGSGGVQEDRYTALLNFMALARSNGLLTIVDIHNTGMRECSGCDWTDNYMWGIYSSSSIRDRHTRFLVDLMTRLARDVDHNTFVLGTANEPIEQRGWYEYQAQLVPQLQAACGTCYFTVMSHDWQGIEATIWMLDPFPNDDYLIYDVHMYDPLPLTHCSFPGQPNRCPGLQYPGTFTDWRGTGYWDRDRLDSLIAPIAEWRDRQGVFVHMSEFGTAAALADDVRARYLGDMASLLRSYGIGFTQFEWGQNFGIASAPLSLRAVFSPQDSTLPPNVETPVVLTLEPTATPSPVPSTCTITTTYAQICVVETRPPDGSTHYFRVVTSISPVYRIAITVNDRWRADDDTAPYDFIVSAEPGARVSALVYYNTRDNYRHGDWTFANALPTPTFTLTPTPSDTPTITPTVTPTDTTTPEPETLEQLLEQADALISEQAENLAEQVQGLAELIEIRERIRAMLDASG